MGIFLFSVQAFIGRAPVRCREDNPSRRSDQHKSCATSGVSVLFLESHLTSVAAFGFFNRSSIQEAFILFYFFQFRQMP